MGKYAVIAKHEKRGEIQLVKVCKSETEANELAKLGNTPMNPLDFCPWFFYVEVSS